MYTVQEVVERLEAEGITSSRQMVQRWLKEGRIKADKPLRRKDGYKVTKEALEEFIASWNEARRPKRTDEEYEAEIQRLKEELEQVKAENVRPQEELAMAEDREKFLSVDLHNANEKLENQKRGPVDWKKKYDEQLKRSQEKTNKLIAAEREIEILKGKLANPEEYSIQDTPVVEVIASDEPVLSFTERFQFQKKKYEVRVYTYRGAYTVYIFEGWGRYQKSVQIDKDSPLFKRFLEIVRGKHGVSVEMALASWKQTVPVD